jgi:hypothetical protein
MAIIKEFFDITLIKNKLKQRRQRDVDITMIKRQASSKNHWLEITTKNC